MKECIAIILTILVAAWFWVMWWNGMQTYITEKKTITTMLSNQGLSQIRVFPKREGCYTYNARKNEVRIVTGKICLEDE